ncbi:unnamed protein product [Tetraodon nigroviridis]|uniref:(spotted green pufferfish) hypothetical protein n=1 Tax=Tetraodon nigroviridis TaxID=99883 RepID=Q4TC70_TETNG|nr:unnamed protein product [Tetraodon nigroviridis]
MAQINTCLKRVFTIFNIFFAVVGGLILGLALLSHILINSHGGQLEGHGAGLISLYVMGAVTMMIAVVGAYGAHKGEPTLSDCGPGGKVPRNLNSPQGGGPPPKPPPAGETPKQKKPPFFCLDEASQDVKDMGDELQRELHCCGLFSYKDWEGNIPDSCVCTEGQECQRVSSRARLLPISIYSKPCFPIIVPYILLVVDIMIGVVFALAVLAIMIHQMRYPARPATVLTVPAIFTTAPPKYQELHNAPLPRLIWVWGAQCKTVLH